jgi:hypothetical protein
MEKNVKISEEEAMEGKVEESVEKDGWWAKTKRGCKKHKKAIIAVIVGVVGLAAFLLTREENSEILAEVLEPEIGVDTGETTAE